MQVKHRYRTLSFAWKSALAGAALVASTSQAAGLGKLTVQSALGQPLRAEIELTAVSAEDAGAIAAKLASPDAFRLANIEFNPALTNLRFNVETRNGRQIIRITSAQPINEPFVDMLLELTWNGGRIVREYTFLLDPAEIRQNQPAQATAPVAVQSVGDKVAPRPEPKSQTAKPATAPKGASVSEYRVKPGDTLGTIAKEIRPEGMPLDTMMVALYRANPDAFFGNNINRLKSGRVLVVPAAQDLAAIETGEAHRTVRALSSDFGAYRGKLAEQVETAAPGKAPEAGQNASGKITTKVEEKPTAVNTARDQLKLSKASATSGAAGKGGTGHADEVAAREQELQEAKQRVKELETDISKLQKMLSLKGQPVPAKPTEAPKPVEAAKPVEPPKPKPVASAVSKPKAPAKKVVVAPQPSITDLLMDNIAIIGGALAAALGGGLLLAMRRRRGNKVEVAPAEPSLQGAPSTKAPAMFAETGGQSVDTNNSVFNSSFAPSASQLDTNEVDPVAEADVYIAYGRDAQAEEILKEALRTHPERHPVRLKLLEIYASRKDQRAFETQAKELHVYTNGEGEEWAQAAALGLTIDPLNPLYQSAASAAAPAPAPTDESAALAAALEQAMAAPDLDLDLSAEATTEAPPPAPAVSDEPHIDSNSLDFDLGDIDFKSHGKPNHGAPAPAPAAAVAEPAADMMADLSFDEMPTATAAAPAPAPAAEPLPDLGMDFDMGLDLPATPAPAAEAPAASDALDMGGLSLDDFDLSPAASPAPAAAPPADLDLAALAADFDLPATPSPAPDTAVDLDNPLAALDAMDFDLPATPSPAPAAEPMDDLSFDTLDMGDAPTAAPTPAPTLADFDLASIDLDLPAPSAEPVPAEFKDEDIAAMAEPPSELSPEHQEMETKLDLAVAYQEIGDKEGARELIAEVIKGGSSNQIQRAQELQALLG